MTADLKAIRSMPNGTDVFQGIDLSAMRHCIANYHQTNRNVWPDLRDRIMYLSRILLAKPGLGSGRPTFEIAWKRTAGEGLEKGDPMKSPQRSRRRERLGLGLQANGTLRNVPPPERDQGEDARANRLQGSDCA
jgi:hypothetical protein